MVSFHAENNACVSIYVASKKFALTVPYHSLSDADYYRTSD